jgi:hypothetical protein
MYIGGGGKREREGEREREGGQKRLTETDRRTGEERVRMCVNEREREH